MPDEPVHLAVHAGQSQITLSVADGAQPLVMTSPGIEAHKPLAPQWARAIRAFLAAHRDLAVGTVSLGASGLGRETAHDLLALLTDTTVRRVLLAHDSVTHYLGALGNGPGCVIASHTGTVCLAVGPRQTARVDGWGHLVGDAGSSFWIGRAGIDAALRGHDGRRQMTALTAALTDRFPDVEHAYIALQLAPDRVARIASFASVVAELAPTDRVAGNILDKAAAQLSEAVQAAIRRAELSGPRPPRVAAVGAVFGNERVLRRFTDFLTLQWPTFALCEPAGGPVEGARALVRVAAGHPLFGSLSIAER